MDIATPESSPWDYHPDLTRDALVAVAALIAQGRSDALARFNPDIGDDGWTLGCCGFQFARFRITAAAGTPGYAWLSILDGSKQVIFKIGSVPVRFYKGEADDPSDRTLRQTLPELNQLAFVFGGEDGGELAYRFAIEIDIDGAVAAIKFVGLRGETPVFCWDVPYLDAVELPAAVPETKGVEIGKPKVGVPGAERNQQHRKA